MKIQLASDLHLEFSDYHVHNAGADMLILAGDILLADYLKRSDDSEKGRRYRDFLARCADDFDHVIYIAGNHEFYNGDFVGSLDVLHSYCDQWDHVHFMENDTVCIMGVTFVGATLWTDLNRRDPLTVHAVDGMMNDYQQIRNDSAGYRKLQAVDTLHRHDHSLAYIKNAVSVADDPVVVVTHHTPSFLSCDEQYKDDTVMNGAFHSELGDYIADQPKIRYWVHGHTHTACDYTIGDTRVLCNPRGYETYNGKEHTGWDPNLIFEV